MNVLGQLRMPHCRRMKCQIFHNKHFDLSTLSGVDSSIQKDQNVKPFKDIPGPAGLPFFGTLFKYTIGSFSPASYHEALLQHYKQYGPIFKETIAGHTVVHLLDPEYIQAWYRLEGKVPHIAPLLETTQMYRKSRDISAGLGNINGEEWYRLRKSINSMMLRPKGATMFLPQVNQVVREFLDHLHAIRDPVTGKVSDFSAQIHRWILESSARTCFEKELGCLDAESDSFQLKMIQANKSIFETSLKLKFALPWYKVMPNVSKNWKKLVEVEDYLFSQGKMLVDETVCEIERLQSEGLLTEDNYGFLTFLLGKEELSYMDVIVLAISLFADGISTTAPSLLCQLYCLASNPDKQEKLYQEICELTSDPSDPVTSEIINKASYLKACIKEGFRLYPIAMEVSRIPQTDVVLGGYLVPAGTQVDLNNHRLLRLPEYFTEPDVYQPERWVRGGSAEDINPFLLLPFGFGSRTCAGRRFAEQEMQVLLIKLLQHFKLEWAHPQEMGQVFKILLTPDTPCHIRLVPRD